ncbi:hypothetical protein P7C73_g1670, partial [Tremellales sp. Uapishka_1]
MASMVNGSVVETSSASASNATLANVNATLDPGVSDPHSHHHSHAAPKTVLDDEAIHRIHHFPPSYLAADFRLSPDTAIFGEEFDDEWDPSAEGGARGWMIVHVAGMVGAYFGALPIALALRASNHPSHYLSNVAFLIIASAGWFAGAVYKAKSASRYEGAVHGSMGNMLVLLSISLALLDSCGLIQRSWSLYRKGESPLSALQQAVVGRKRTLAASQFEMAGLMEESDIQDRVVFTLGDDDEEAEVENTRPSRPILHIRDEESPSRSSTGSDGTLQDAPSPVSTHGYRHYVRKLQAMQDGEAAPQAQPVHRKTVGWKRAGEIALTWTRRMQVVFAYVAILTGIVTYSGMCRAGFINTCAAHLVKGSIFFLYGIITFSRYLGAYADLGWAWNRRPDGKGPSAEMVECAVIFLYGISNTWMERFGAPAGAPYTVKQVQHISIAVMLDGCLARVAYGADAAVVRHARLAKTRAGELFVELQSPAGSGHCHRESLDRLSAPELTEWQTGVAMAAHHQDYVFQVAIHSLWGVLLAGGSTFRFLTYFFLWLKPPTDSEMPSRPPTEVLTSFGYAAGGIVFMLSAEEVSFAAMRSGFDDPMAFLNFTIAITSLIFCWITVVMAIKGFASLRVMRRSRR